MPQIIIDARSAAVSEYLRVKRILPFRKRRMVGPFIFLDHAEPAEQLPADLSQLDVLPHPHIGLSTISYLFQGEITHRDSLGVKQVIKPGEVNWMTAGKGISHSERFENPASLSGGMEMIQTWVALPEKDEEADPSFINYKPGQLVETEMEGTWMRLIAGNAFGMKSSVRVNSPLFYIHAEMMPGARMPIPKGYAERGVYILHGEIETGNVWYKAGQMLVYGKTEDVILKAHSKSTLLLLGGEPLGERFIWWNFVSSRKERIEQAMEDWKQGRIILPPGDDKEFIPLPEDNSKPAGSNPAPEPLS